MVTLIIQYKNGDSDELQLPFTEAMELIMQKYHKKLPDIAEIQMKTGEAV
jgi:hypothetical protein